MVVVDQGQPLFLEAQAVFVELLDKGTAGIQALAGLSRHAADTNVFAAQRLMVGNNLVEIVDDVAESNMGRTDFQFVLAAQFHQRIHAQMPQGRDLDSVVADGLDGGKRLVGTFTVGANAMESITLRRNLILLHFVESPSSIL